jgi:hypothetical protein
MNGDGVRAARPGDDTPAARESVESVSLAVAGWVGDVGRFLGVLQTALEQSRPNDDASTEVRALAPQLPALIRQCRAQVPTPEMIRTWVKSLSVSEAELPEPVEV